MVHIYEATAIVLSELHSRRSRDIFERYPGVNTKVKGVSPFGNICAARDIVQYIISSLHFAFSFYSDPFSVFGEPMFVH